MINAMRKIFAILTLALVFFFSVLGEGSLDSCQVSFKANSATNTQLSDQSDSAADLKLAINDVAAGEDLHLEHVCHIGHCAFTLQKPHLVKVINSNVTSRTLSSYVLILDGHSSETLRPPCLV